MTLNEARTALGLEERRTWLDVIIQYYSRFLSLPIMELVPPEEFFVASWTRMLGLPEMSHWDIVVHTAIKRGVTRNSFIHDVVLKHSVDGLGLRPDHFREDQTLADALIDLKQRHERFDQKLNDAMCQKRLQAA